MWNKGACATEKRPKNQRSFTDKTIHGKNMSTARVLPA